MLICEQCHFEAGDAYDITEEGLFCPRCEEQLVEYEEVR